LREVASVCRYCPGVCGVRVSVDDHERITEIRGDARHPMTAGYVCIKGVAAPEAANGPSRLLHPLARQRDGSFRRIGLETALDEIAERLRGILRRGGPRAVALFKGTQTYFNVTASQMIADWLAALGSPSFYTTATIDQSAKVVTAGRMGSWDAGRQRMADADVMLLVGTNPLVAVSTGGWIMFNVARRLKEARARGMKLVVVDPRRTETARHADVFLQPRPGEDVTLVAGLLRIVLHEGWFDADFCARHVAQLDALRAALEPFDPERVARRTGVAVEDLHRAAATFARDARRGIATTGTGATMSPRSNLADHLVECLNVVCGRMAREGDRIANPGVLAARRAFRAEVIPPTRPWERGPRSRARDVGTLMGEMMSGLLADEILLPGEGQVRALLVAGGNPALALPDQRKAVRALADLELLVAVDPHLSETARLAHYVLPTRLQYERTDLLFGPGFEPMLNIAPFQQWIPAVVPPPPDAEVMEDWYLYWALAKRLDLPLSFAGAPLDLERPPTTESLLALLARDAQVPFTELRKHAEGRVFDVEPCFVEAARPGHDARFEVAPPDVVAELALVAAEDDDAGSVSGGRRFSHRLVVRRMREMMNSHGRELPSIRSRVAFNPAFLHPDDLAALGLESGDRAELVSDHGRIPAIVEADSSLRRGVVSMSHGWGGLPDEARSYEEAGASTNLLISTDRCIEPINAMPRLSAIPVDVVPVGRGRPRPGALAPDPG